MGIGWGSGLLIIDLESPLRRMFFCISNQSWVCSHRFLYCMCHFGFPPGIWSSFAPVQDAAILFYPPPGHLQAARSCKSVLIRTYRHKPIHQSVWDTPISLFRTADSSRYQCRSTAASSPERSPPASARMRWLHRSTYESTQCRFFYWHGPGTRKSGS